MKPTVERLSEQFTRLVGPEAFAKAEAAIAAAKAAAEAAATAAAEKAAAAAAAKVAAEKAAAAKAAAVAGSADAGQSASPAVVAAKPAAAVSAAPKPAVAAAQPGSPTPATARPATPAPASAAPRPTTAAPAATPAPLPTLPVQVTSHAAKGYDFDAAVAPAQVVAAAQLLAAEGFALDTITGVDWIAQNEMEVVYDYFHPLEVLRVVVRTRVPRATPELPSITAVFPGANWHERETHDFFGIWFTGHPNLKPFLLPEDAKFHPLRKDYQP